MAALADIVRAGQGRAVEGGVVDADRTGAGAVQGDGEGHRTVGLVDHLVAHLDDRRPRGPVVVDDGSPTGLARDRTVDGPEQVQGHVFGALGRGVVQDRDIDHLGGLARREGQGPGLGQIVTAIERGFVGIVEIDGDHIGGRRVEADHELEQAVGLARDGVGDSDQRRGDGRRVISADSGAAMGLGQQGGADRAGEHQVEILPPLGGGVVDQVDRDRLDHLTGQEVQDVAALGDIVRAGHGGAVGSGVADADIAGARPARTMSPKAATS